VQAPALCATVGGRYLVPHSVDLPKAYRLDKGEQRDAHASSRPRCVFIEVTNRCNLACVMCVRTFLAYEPPRDLSWEEFVAIADQFPAMERAVLHGVGEPLLSRALPDMIRYLKRRGITVLFNSNGTLLTPRWQEALVESGLDEFRLSLDAVTPELYAQLRGKPLFETVLANVQALVATKERLGVTTPRISLWCVGMQENIEQLPELIRVAAKIGVPEVYVQRLTYALDSGVQYGIGQSEQALFGRVSVRELAILDECEQLSRALGVTFQASGATDPRSSLRAAEEAACSPWRACQRPWTTAYITANGNVLPCCMAHWADTDYRGLILGNIWEKRFEQIWNDAPYQDWRRGLLTSNPPPACRGCGVCWSL
jgi:radical SAM protein with 4Fe4S-binding SPASM domain